MIALAIVVLDVLGDRAPEMALTERHDPIEAFLLDRAHEAFGVGIRVRRLVLGAHDLDRGFTQLFENPVRPFRVAIANQYAA